jgi:hypothetical protein
LAKRFILFLRYFTVFKSGFFKMRPTGRLWPAR